MYSWLVPNLTLPAYELLTRKRAWTEARRLRQLQWRSAEELESRTLGKLQALLMHASEHVPYHREMFRRAGLTPGDIRSVADLARLPISTKADMRAWYPHGVFARNLPDSRRKRRTTSGSTGEPYSLYLDRAESDALNGAFLFYFQEWAGAALWLTRYRVTGPSHPDVVEEPQGLQRLARQWLFGQRIVHLSGHDLTAPAFLAWNARQPPGRRYFIWGYSSYIARLAARLLDEGGSNFSKPVAVICSAETLTARDAATIQTAFGCPATNHYSCWESPHVAQSCPDNPSVLHVNGERAILRTVREDGSAASSGESGRVVLTSLGNYVMPFINYDLGDRACTGVPCACGRGFPTIAGLEGRAIEVIRTPSGRAFTQVMLSRTLTSRSVIETGIWQYQVEQTAVDELVLRVVPGAVYQADLGERLRANLEADLGPGVRVRLESVDQIQAEPSGKRLVIKPFRGTRGEARPPDRHH